MLHARHREQAIDSLKGGKSAPQTAVDKAVVRDIKLGGSANTELLAYVEGFMTAFHLTAPPLGPQHPLFIDLLGMLETTKVDPWHSANESVRDEALGRLHEYYCNTMDAAHRAAFDAWVASLEAQVAKDAQAIKSGAGGAAAITAKRNAERMFDHFTAGMKEVATMACAAPAAAALELANVNCGWVGLESLRYCPRPSPLNAAVDVRRQLRDASPRGRPGPAEPSSAA